MTPMSSDKVLDLQRSPAFRPGHIPTQQSWFDTTTSAATSFPQASCCNQEELRHPSAPYSTPKPSHQSCRRSDLRDEHEMCSMGSAAGSSSSPGSSDSYIALAEAVVKQQQQRRPFVATDRGCAMCCFSSCCCCMYAPPAGAYVPLA